MTTPLLTVGATVTCPHGGQGTVAPSQSVVLAGGVVCTQSDQVVIAGCPFFVGPVASPCLTVQWLSASTTSSAGGAPVLTVNSVGLCLNAAQAPQGPVVLAPAQSSAGAT